MRVADVKVVIDTNNKNGSYMMLPSKLTAYFAKDKQDAILLFLPFRHSAVLKSLGITKDDFDKHFQKSGMSCTLMNMQQFSKLVEDIKTLYQKAKDREVMLRYVCGNASRSSTGKFAIPFTLRNNFVGGDFKIIAVFDEESGRVRAEIIEGEVIQQVKKIAPKLHARLPAPKQSKGRTK